MTPLVTLTRRDCAGQSSSRRRSGLPLRRRRARRRDACAVEGSRGRAAAPRLRRARLWERRDRERNAPHARGLPRDRRRRGRPRPARRGHDGSHRSCAPDASCASSSGTSSPPRARAPSPTARSCCPSSRSGRPRKRCCGSSSTRGSSRATRWKAEEGQPSHHRVEVVARVAPQGLATPRALAGPGRGGRGPARPAEAGRAAVGGEGTDRGPALDRHGLPGVRAVAGALPGALTALEEDFARSMAEQARRKDARLRRAAVAVVIAGLARAAIAIGVSRQRAVAAALRSEASRVTGAGAAAPRGGPDRGARLRDGQPRAGRLAEARVFAMKALGEGPPAWEVAGRGRSVRAPAFSPDGKQPGIGRSRRRRPSLARGREGPVASRPRDDLPAAQLGRVGVERAPGDRALLRPRRTRSRVGRCPRAAGRRIWSSGRRAGG